MGTQVSEVKKILRQQMREAMAEMTEQEKAWSDQELVSAFLAHPKLDEANTVMLYYGVGQEIATADLIQTLLDQGKTVCLPKCLPEHQMEARIIQSLDELEPDAYGIPAPKDACPVLEREKIDLILVPGLCFDSKGNRLGQGGGYYDRFLPKLSESCTILAAGFDCQLVGSPLPHDATDYRLPEIWTPSQQIRTRKPF